MMGTHRKLLRVASGLLLIVWAMALSLVIGIAAAEPQKPDTASYPVDYVQVIDGDTIKASVEVWPNIVVHTSVRIRGINTPETHTRRVCEKRDGLKAKAVLERLIDEGYVLLKNVELGTFAGRVVADVYLPSGESVADKMLKFGWAVPYDGKKRRQPWVCKAATATVEGGD